MTLNNLLNNTIVLSPAGADGNGTASEARPVMELKPDYLMPHSSAYHEGSHSTYNPIHRVQGYSALNE